MTEEKLPEHEPMSRSSVAQPALARAEPEPVDSLGIPLSCGGPLCAPGRRHPLCRITLAAGAQAVPRHISPAPKLACSL